MSSTCVKNLPYTDLETGTVSSSDPVKNEKERDFSGEGQLRSGASNVLKVTVLLFIGYVIGEYDPEPMSYVHNNSPTPTALPGRRIDCFQCSSLQQATRLADLSSEYKVPAGQTRCCLNTEEERRLLDKLIQVKPPIITYLCLFIYLFYGIL